MKVHKNLYITGRVQHVYYRISAKEEADRLGIKGFIQNMPDGSVYAEVEGDEHLISIFIAWCHRGPVTAKVVEVKIENAEMVNFEKFIVWR